MTSDVPIVDAPSSDPPSHRGDLTDPTAFEALYRRMATRAYSVAYRICRSPQVAEDVTQQSFLEAWRRADRFDPQRGSIETWIFMIVRHRSLDAVRRIGAHERRWDYGIDCDAVPATGAEPVDRAIDADRTAAIRRLLTALPETQRQVIELAYFDGLSQTEIATRLALPVGTVKGRMRLALHKLRDGIAIEDAGRPA
jgi:RNA polymerase sigma-70 factor (ECF subfamily)